MDYLFTITVKGSKHDMKDLPVHMKHTGAGLGQSFIQVKKCARSQQEALEAVIRDISYIPYTVLCISILRTSK